MTREHIQALTMLFLILAAVFSGVGLMFYAIEHVWLFVLMVFCLVCGLTIDKENSDEKTKKVTKEDLVVTLNERGIKDEVKQEKIIERLQVNGCLIAMVADVLDSLIKYEEGMCKLLEVRYKNEQKMYRNGMIDSAKKYTRNMRGFTQHFFGTEINDNLEDNAQDIYDIIKLLADHTNDHKDMETIKRNLRKRKLNHHLFDL